MDDKAVQTDDRVVQTDEIICIDEVIKVEMINNIPGGICILLHDE